MYKKLHLQLTLSGTAVSGLILVFMSVLCLFFSETEEKKEYFSDFQINVNLMISHLEQQTILSHAWLSQFQTDTGLAIDIQDNGRPLVFDRLNPHDGKSGAFRQIREIAREKYLIPNVSGSFHSLLPSHAEFPFFDSGTNEDYYASVVSLPKNGSVLDIAVLYPFSELNRTFLRRRLVFAGACLAGLILLGVFFGFFTGRMIAPLKEAQQKQMEFIASASHELRSPLAVIRSCLSAVKQASPEETGRFLSLMDQESRRMSRLVNDMLTLSGSDAASFSLDSRPEELDTLLLSVYETYEPLARQKSIPFSIRLPETSDTVCICDKARLAQALGILLDNAFCYSPAGKDVTLSLQVFPDRFLICVADHGAGIPDDEKKAVFDRFYRCDKAHKDKEHFGLGLCIAQRLIQMHRWKIWIEDTPGGGASFLISGNLR